MNRRAFITPLGGAAAWAARGARAARSGRVGYVEGSESYRL
jgi:hypothetical protein